MTTISIITSTLNAREGLQKTAQSLRGQTRRNALQWVIADGVSADGTLDIIRDNQDLIDYWHSQKDSGIYNAWNTLLPHLRGDWVLVLGAG
jgi:glycosyltransferase involved in cell wall biosynthesis